jgi:hypothetical protein
MSDNAATMGKPTFSPFNIVAGVILLVGGILTILRFTLGLDASHQPVRLQSLGDLDRVRPAGRRRAGRRWIRHLGRRLYFWDEEVPRRGPAGHPDRFLGYALVVFGPALRCGPPLAPALPVHHAAGTTSLLFEVAACVALYLTVLFIEFSPAALEWLGLKRARSIVVKLTMLLTIFGVVLSTLHQSSLGALFLIAPSKLHPLWYTPYLPIYFFVTAVIAGLVHGDLRKHPVPPLFLTQNGRRPTWRKRTPAPGIRQSGRLRAGRLLSSSRSSVSAAATIGIIWPPDTAPGTWWSCSVSWPCRPFSMPWGCGTRISP